MSRRQGGGQSPDVDRRRQGEGRVARLAVDGSDRRLQPGVAVQRTELPRRLPEHRHEAADQVRLVAEPAEVGDLCPARRPA